MFHYVKETGNSSYIQFKSWKKNIKGKYLYFDKKYLSMYKLNSSVLKDTEEFIRDNYDNVEQFASIPNVEITDSVYKMRKIDTGDNLGLLVGEITDCCQYIDGIGHVCAAHGYLKGDSDFYVIEKNGKVIVQSWVWRKDDCMKINGVYCPSVGIKRKNSFLQHLVQ